MRRFLATAGLLAASLFASAAAAECREADAAMLAMSLHDFDQTEAGWRSNVTTALQAFIAAARRRTSAMTA